MTTPRPLDQHELGADRPDELDAALAAGSWLAAAIETPAVSPSAGFADRVMAALAGEPAPALVGFMEPVRSRGFLAGFAASVRQAWASIGEGARPPLARASALAYVLAVAIAGTSLAGVATVGVAGALGVLGPTSTQSAPPPGPLTSPDSSAPPESPRPTDLVTVAPSESPEASDDEDGPGASDDHGSGPEPSDDRGGKGPDASDDHGDNQAEATDDHGNGEVEPSDSHDESGSGSGSDSHDAGLGSN